MRAIALRMAITLGLLVALVVPAATAPGEIVAPGTSPDPSGPVANPPLPSDTPAATPVTIPPSEDEPAGETTSAIVPGSVNRTTIAIGATYNVYAYLGYGSRALNVDSRMIATNRSGVGIDRIELNTIAARLGNFRLRVATVDGRPARIRRSDQTLIVPLGGVLPSGQSVSIRIAYGSTLRTTLGGSDWMFTRANGIINAYRWIPWVSRSHPFNRPNHGDPFVTPVSPEVRLRIRTDRPMTLATSGERTAFDGVTKTFIARNVRDFTLTASPYYRTRSTTLGDTAVDVYYRQGAPYASMLAVARRAIGRMEALVGPYPYPRLKVVQSAGGFGMESPGLIWIPRGAANLTYLVTHETAHQWFYSLIGNDQAREPFNDEAAADFLARFTLGQRRASRCGTARLDLSIYSYSATCYYEVVYIQGGNFLDDLRRRMGGTAFWRGMRAYVAAHRFRLATTRSLLDTLDANTSQNLVPTFARRFPRLY